MPWLGDGGTLQRIGDAFAGVDREKAFRAGQLERATYDTQLTLADENRAQTESALATARERQAQAQINEDVRASMERVRLNPRGALNYNDPTFATDAMLAKLDYANMQQGRGHLQEQNLRSTIASNVGDEMRLNAEEALAPGSAVTARYAGPNAEIAVGPDGKPRYYSRQQAIADHLEAGKVFDPDSGSGSGSGDGMYESADMNTIKNIVVWEFGGFTNPQTGEITGLDETTRPTALWVMGRAAQITREYKYNHADATSIAMQEAKSQGMAMPTLPPKGPPPVAAVAAPAGATPQIGTDLGGATGAAPAATITAPSGEPIPAMPEVGYVRNGRQFLGGDPTSPQAWGPVGAAPAASPAAPVVAPAAPVVETPAAPPAAAVAPPALGAELEQEPRSLLGRLHPGGRKTQRELREAAEREAAAQPSPRELQAKATQESIVALLAPFGGDLAAAPPNVQRVVEILMQSAPNG